MFQYQYFNVVNKEFLFIFTGLSIKRFIKNLKFIKTESNES
jgi:hypothetical protein